MTSDPRKSLTLGPMRSEEITVNKNTNQAIQHDALPEPPRTGIKVADELITKALTAGLTVEVTVEDHDASHTYSVRFAYPALPGIETTALAQSCRTDNLTMCWLRNKGARARFLAATWSQLAQNTEYKQLRHAVLRAVHMIEETPAVLAGNGTPAITSQPDTYHLDILDPDGSVYAHHNVGREEAHRIAAHPTGKTQPPDGNGVVTVEGAATNMGPRTLVLTPHRSDTESLPCMSGTSVVASHASGHQQDGEFVSGPHLLANTGEPAPGSTASAFTCSRCGQRARLAEFGVLKCTRTQETTLAEDDAQLLNDATSKDTAQAEEGPRTLVEAGHAQLGTLAEKWASAVDSEAGGKDRTPLHPDVTPAPASSSPSTRPPTAAAEPSIAPQDTTEAGMAVGPHRIVNTGGSIDGAEHGTYAFVCGRCDQRATLADFEYGKVKCTEKAEAEWSRERADGLLDDVTFQHTSAYAFTFPDEHGEPKTHILDRPTAREAVALWLRAGGKHVWHKGEMRVTCFGAEHSVRSRPDSVGALAEDASKPVVVAALEVLRLADVAVATLPGRPMLYREQHSSQGAFALHPSGRTVEIEWFIDGDRDEWVIANRDAKRVRPLRNAALDQIADVFRTAGWSVRWKESTNTATRRALGVYVTSPGADDAAPLLDEMGTDDLLHVLRARGDDVPADSTFARAWARMDRILTDGGIECLPAPWDGHPDAPVAHVDTVAEGTINLAARFMPQVADEEGSHPFIVLDDGADGDIRVGARIECGRLRVGIATDEMALESPFLRPADVTMPVVVQVNGVEVYRA